MNFRLGRYYLRNGFKAEVKNYFWFDRMTLAYYGYVLIPHNIWVPTFWYKDGNSLNSRFDLIECVEGTEKIVRGRDNE